MFLERPNVGFSTIDKLIFQRSSVTKQSTISGWSHESELIKINFSKQGPKYNRN